MNKKHWYKLILSIALISVLCLNVVIESNAIGPEISIASGIEAAMGASGITGTSYGISASGFTNLHNQSQSDPYSWTTDYTASDFEYVPNATSIGQRSYDKIKIKYPLSDFCREQGIYYCSDNNISQSDYVASTITGKTYSQIPFVTVYGNYTASCGDIGTLTDGTYTNAFADGGSAIVTVVTSPSKRLTNTSTYPTGTTHVANNTNANLNRSWHWAVYVTGSNTLTISYALSPDDNPSAGILSSGGYQVTDNVATDLDIRYINDQVTIASPKTNKDIDIYIPSGYVPNGTPSGTQNNWNNVEDILDGLTNAYVNNDVAETEWVGDSPVPPTPTPTPYPTDALGDIPYDEFAGTLFPKLDDIDNSIDTVGQSIEDKLDDVADSVNDTIGLGTSTITSWLSDIYDAIIDGVADIVDAIEAIAEAILEGIDDFVVDILGDVPSVFGGWFSDLSDAFGIWHYVVEWFNCIAGYFTFLRTIASGMPSCFWAPVLAVVAGTIVLGVYKRFLQ